MREREEEERKRREGGMRNSSWGFMSGVLDSWRGIVDSRYFTEG
jgi:hypothetical protein